MINITLLKNVRCMRLNAKLQKDLLAKVVNYACFITNRSPFTTTNFKIPEEVWTNNPFDYSVLKIFGCLYMFICKMENDQN
jgi:hypothetical protein